MAFFGLTTLGATDPVHEASAKSQTYFFHEIPQEQYIDAFNQFLLGETSDVAITMDVDGTRTVLRASLGDMLKVLLGRQPRKHELDAWFTHIDFDRTPLLDIEEYLKCVSNLADFARAPTLPREYGSYDTYRLSWMRSVRVGYEAPKSYKAPLTTAQDIGWHCLKPGPAEERKTLHSTDVTIKEGNNARSYYGHFIVPQ